MIKLIIIGIVLLIIWKIGLFNLLYKVVKEIFIFIRFIYNYIFKNFKDLDNDYRDYKRNKVRIAKINKSIDNNEIL